MRELSVEEQIKRGKDPKKQLQGLRSKVMGGNFEQMITNACKAYMAKGFANIEKTPEPMKPLKALPGGRFVACFEHSAQPDFKGVVKGGRSIVFEAKHTDTGRINCNRVTEDQANTLKIYNDLGAIAFVIVSFGLEKFYRVPWEDWENMKEIYGHKYITPEDLDSKGNSLSLPSEPHGIAFLVAKEIN